MSHYLPEVHDVHPGAAGAVESLLALLSPAARRCAALLAVPRWSPESPSDVDAGAQFLRTLQEHAGQIVLHGLTHAAPATWWSRFRQGSRNDSEFARASFLAARTWIDAGAAALASATGSRPLWFCAPRWEQSPSTAAALRVAGFAGWMLRDRLVLASGGELLLPAIWFDDGERPWVQSAARRRRAHRLARLFAARTPFRLALHPRDLSAPGVEREIRSVLARLDADGWTPFTLGDAAGLRPSGDRGSVRP